MNIYIKTRSLYHFFVHSISIFDNSGLSPFVSIIVIDVCFVFPFFLF